MAGRFKSLKVIPSLSLGPAPTGGFSVYWEIEGHSFVPTFNLEEAPTESGPWSAPLLVANTSDLFALNVSTPMLNQQALRWFRVKVYNGLTLAFTSNPVDHRNRLNKPDYLFYREHLRRARLTLEKKVGTQGWLLRRMIYGATCTQCVHPIHKTPTNQECSVCYGTGITGGYHPAFAMWADWGQEGPPRLANTSTEQPGPIQIVRSRISLFPLPEAKAKDLWADMGTRYIYEIEKVEGSHLRGAMFWQLLSLSRLPAQHPAYRFTLPT